MAAMNTRAMGAGASSPPPAASLASPPPSKPAQHALPHNVQKALQQVGTARAAPPWPGSGARAAPLTGSRVQVQEEAARQQAPSYGKQAAMGPPGGGVGVGVGAVGVGVGARADWAARYRAPPPLHHPPHAQHHARLPQHHAPQHAPHPHAHPQQLQVRTSLSHT